MKTRVTELFGIDYPILCGAMARISTPKLVAAVSNAGGLGVLNTGPYNGEEITKMIRETRALTNKPFAVNLVMISPTVDEAAKAVCDEKVEIVTTAAGNPARFFDQLKSSSVKIISVVASVRAATKMAALGADAIVCEGMEAGGHVGETTSMCLIPQIRDAVKIPVIGAGGCGDGRAMAAMFILGAEGVQLGSAFLLADECEIHDNYKQAVIDANDMSTVITGRYVKHGVRTIKNDLAKILLEFEARRAPTEEFDSVATGGLPRAVYNGDIKMGSLMCGQIGGLLKKRQTAKQIIETMNSEAEKILGNISYIDLYK